MADQKGLAGGKEAQRQLELVLYLAGVPSASVRDIIGACDAYSGYSNEDSASRQVRRDVEALRDLGYSVHAMRRPGGERSWRVDAEATYAALDPADRELRLLVAGLTAALQAVSLDGTFERSAALRGALAKLSGQTGRATSVATAVAGTELSRSAKRLVDAVHNQHELRFEYADSAGEKSVRTVRPYGCYQLNGHLYLVAHTVSVERNGLAEADGAVKRYRDDRIGKLERLSATYEIPADFDVDEWKVPPFMIGESLGEVRFACADSARAREILAKTAGVSEKLENGELAFAECTSWEAAASWAVGEEVCPTAPEQAVRAYDELVADAARGVLETLAERGRKLTQGRRRESGRPNTKGATEQFIAALGLFAAPGARWTTAQVAQHLGVHRSEALAVLDSLSVTYVAGGGVVPLVHDEASDAWFMDEFSEYEVKPLRLSGREAEAVTEGLAQVGIAEESLPGFGRLKAAFWPVDEVLGDDDSGERREEPSWAALSGERFGQMLMLSEAIAKDRGCRFDYQGRADAEAHERKVAPLSLFSKNGQQYLSAFDFGRGAMRQFRIDRMGRLQVAELSAEQRAALDGWNGGLSTSWLSDAEQVELLFTEESQLSFFNWEGLQVTEKLADGRWKATAPDLGTTWLPRHIAAFGGKVTTTSKQLADRVAEYVARL